MALFNLFFTLLRKFRIYYPYSFIQHIFIGFLLNSKAIAVNQTNEAPAFTAYSPVETADQKQLIPVKDEGKGTNCTMLLAG